MDIIIFIISLLISIIPSIILYKWIKKKNDNEKYKELCQKAFKKGIKIIFPIFLGSAITFIIGKLLIRPFTNDIIYQMYYTFIVLAGVEELFKFLAFKKIISDENYKYSWFDITMLMICVGLGFGCIENFTLAIGSNIIVMLIRSISIGHGGYGFIMGWLYGKMLKTKKKIYGVLSFIIPWLMHGLYDFGLSEDLLKINDNFAFISVSLELVCIITVILIIRFIKKRYNSNTYTEIVK